MVRGLHRPWLQVSVSLSGRFITVWIHETPPSGGVNRSLGPIECHDRSCFGPNFTTVSKQQKDHLFRRSRLC